ncbi:MAG: hypothetical protein Q9227_004192 [Pyrenula ochraceoflavens]
MADPISIATGVFGLVQGSLGILRILKSATKTPEELADLQAELEHLGDVVRDVENMTSGRDCTTDDTLVKNMKNAQVKIEQIKGFMQTHIYQRTEQTNVRRTTLIRERPKLKGFAKEVEAARRRLLDCLALANIRQRMPLDPPETTETENPNLSSIPLTTSATETDQSAKSTRTTECATLPPDIGPADSPSDFDLQQSTPSGWSRLSMPTSERISNDIESLVARTRDAVRSENDIFLQHLVQIYRAIGANHAQVQRLALNLRSSETLHQSREVSPPIADHNVDLMYESEDSKSGSDSSTIFFDCVSRFSSEMSDTSIKRLRAKFTGSPDYYLERGSVFYPEEFTSNYVYAGLVSAAAMKEIRSSSTYRVQKYFLIYDHAPRAWRKVTIHASIISLAPNSAFIGIAEQYDALTARRFLPGNLRSQLETIIRSKKLRYLVTNLSVMITESANGQITVDSARTRVRKDLSESQKDKERDILEAIENMGCAQFLQSEVITRKRRGAYTSVVWVESQLAYEYRMPFTGAGLPGHDRVKEFYHDLEKLYSLRDCNNVARFVGVVLDDTRRHIMSYLKEFPRLNSLMTVFADCELRGKRIPWSIREIWAKQIISAVADVHAKPHTVHGLFTLHNIGLRSDGSAILMALGTQYMGFEQLNKRGQMAPESRKQTSNTPLEGVHFRKDIFSLGLALWLLAEHKAAPSGYYCRVNACTSWPRYTCTASHCDPIELPRCTDSDVPAYFNTVIRICRQSEPSARKPARELLRYFDHVSVPSNLAELVDEIVNESQVKRSFDTFAVCDECGTLIDFFHHCAICNVGNFDLCSNCVSSGVHCYVEKHQLVEYSVIGSGNM